MSVIPDSAKEKFATTKHLKSGNCCVMRHSELVPKRWQASVSATFLLFAFAMFAPCTAMSLSPLKVNVEIEIPFAPGSSTLQKSPALKLHSQLPCINSIALDVVIITAVGDNAPSTLDGNAQMNLAAERANVLRRSFLNLGIPDRKIFTQAQAMVEEINWGQTLRPAGGIAKIEYLGNCKASAPEEDCQTLCKRKH